jgi:hypothetical protein
MRAINTHTQIHSEREREREKDRQRDTERATEERREIERRYTSTQKEQTQGGILISYRDQERASERERYR